MDAHPEVARSVTARLCTRIRRLTRRTFEFTTLNVETRLRAHLVRQALSADVLCDGGQLLQAMTHAQIASHIGSTREMVSRLLSQLNAEGIIITARRNIVINKVDLLIRGTGESIEPHGEPL